MEPLDTTLLIAVASILSSILGVIGGQALAARSDTRRDKREKRVIKQQQQAADDVASDRLIKLIEREADKRVDIVRAEFALEIANLKLEHASELATLRAEIATVRRDAEVFRCDVAQGCAHRHVGMTVI